MDNESKIIEVFEKEGKPLKAKEVAELSGVDKKEVDKIIKKLKASEKLESPKACYYQVK